MKLPVFGIHAKRRKRMHGISEKQIANTWMYGEVEPARNGCCRIIGEEITLVVGPNEFIVTMYPNQRKDRILAHTARARRIEMTNPSKSEKSFASGVNS